MILLPTLKCGATAALAALFAGCAAQSVSPAPVTPQRPTFSSDTNTVAQDTFEIESGITLDPGDYFDTPQKIKYGMSDRSELALGFSPIRWQQLPGDDGIGIGDLSVGLRHRFIEETDEAPAVAMQLLTKIPTADAGEGLGTGEVDFFASGSVDKTFEAFTLTGYYQLGVLGRGPGDTDLEHALAIAASAPIDERFGAFGELAGLFATEADTDPIFITLGGTYTSSPELVFDAGFVVGLSDDAPDFALLVGLTHNFGGLQRADLPR